MKKILFIILIVLNSTISLSAQNQAIKPNRIAFISEKLALYVYDLLKEDDITFVSLDENSEEGKLYLNEIEEETIEKLGYFLKPSELFSELTNRGHNDI